VETTYLVPLASTTELGFRLGPGGRQVRRERGGRPPGPPSPWIRPWDKSSAADPIPVPVLKGCTHAPVQPLAGHRLRTCFFQGLVRSNALTTHDFTVLLSQLGLRKWIGLSIQLHSVSRDGRDAALRGYAYTTRPNPGRSSTVDS